ncbi:MAG: GNAT family N-acetyltransferase [Candidatus Lokiarchaeota archaeon]|nr:GNAT family N-acetyltransferase [Candidatus Lokiarchaeota archaeon]
MNARPDNPSGTAPFITGWFVSLQPYDPRDALMYIQWLNDPTCRHYARHVFPQSLESQKKWVAEQITYSQKADAIGFGIWLTGEQRLIGSVGLFGIDYASRNCWMGLVIGEQACWGKGYATDAGALILDYAFAELGLHKVIVGIYSPNKGSQGVARKLGFKLAGTSKEEVFIDGRFVDGLVFELLESGWRVARPGRPGA